MTEPNRMIDRSHILTEKRLPESMTLDQMTPVQAVMLMNEQDAIAVEAVGREARQIGKAVELVSECLSAGGRLFYVGAGTSGRLGALDAAECPPTFRTPPEMVQAILAGGESAMFRSTEGAEDHAEEGAAEIDARGVEAPDIVVGIAAGATTPFVHGALRRATERGARTIFLACAGPVLDEAPVDLVIRPLTGPEVLTGSTRLKAGTATKLVLNMITTLSMVRLGKVYQNLMVDLRATNNKLWDRGTRIVSLVTGLDRDQAAQILRQADGHVKLAIVMHQERIDVDEARKRVFERGGRVVDANPPI